MKRLLSELETLKAQLAQQEGEVTFWKGRFQSAVTKWDASEAQVRELREAIKQMLCQDIPVCECRTCLVGKAALRSAPPSGQLTNRHGQRVSQECFEGRHEECKDTVFGPNACCCTYRGAHTTAHAYATIPFDKPNAGEERKDLARQSSDARDSRPHPFASSEGSPVVVAHTPTDAVGGASEQVPAGEATATRVASIGPRSQADITKDAYLVTDCAAGPQDSPSRSPISIEVFQQDWMPGYAAFRNDGSLEDGAKAHVCLNLSSFLGGVQIGELTAPDLPYLIAESIMHEVIHVLESWANVEFSEERVEALLTKYRDKYHPEAPAYQSCPEREAPDEQAFAQPSRSEWISVEERLPEPTFGLKAYLATNGVVRGIASYNLIDNTRGQQQRRWQWADPRYVIGQTVTHWQELPALPAPPSPACEKEKAE